MTDPVSAYFAAVNAEDWAALAELWEPDAELAAAGARPRHGREAVVAFYPKVLAGYAEHEDRPVRYIRDGSTVVVEVAFTGRTTDGRLVAFDAVDVFEHRGGRHGGPVPAAQGRDGVLPCRPGYPDRLAAPRADQLPLPARERGPRWVADREPFLAGVREESDFGFDTHRIDRLVAGNPEDCIAIQRFRDALGMDYLIMSFRMAAGPAHEEELACIRRFGRDVIPAFR